MSRAGGLGRRALHNLRWLARRSVRRMALPPGRRYWLQVRLEGPVAELASPLTSRRGPGVSLLELLRCLELAAEDPQVAGVEVELGAAGGGWARREALRRALAAVAAAGKPVVAWAESYSTASYCVASAASRIWLAPAGSVELAGLQLERLHLRGLLDRLGVAADVVRVGSHKGAAEVLTRRSMSLEERQQVDLLADDLFAALVEAVGTGRGLAEERVRAWIDQGLHPAEAAQERGLVDGCLYPDQVPRELAQLAPETARLPREGRAGEARRVDVSRYLAWRVTAGGWQPLLRAAPRVAYVVASGGIRRGRGLRGIATATLRPLLTALREDDGIRGVVVRIDSPGGDGLASDLLWRELWLLSREKPLVVSMGDVAASGGYYMAAAGGSVLAERGTLTGSIGVVGGKLNLEALYGRLGVQRDGAVRGARAGLFSEDRPFDPSEREAVRDQMRALYGLFVRRVCEGRGLAPEAVERVAQGRVWTGLRARGHGLVDALGGPLEALREAARRAGIAEGAALQVEIHPRLPRFAGLRAWLELFGADGSGT